MHIGLLALVPGNMFRRLILKHFARVFNAASAKHPPIPIVIFHIHAIPPIGINLRTAYHLKIRKRLKLHLDIAGQFMPLLYI